MLRKLLLVAGLVFVNVAAGLPLPVKPANLRLLSQAEVPPPAGGTSILVLIDSTYTNKHWDVISQWRDQVHREGIFALSFLTAARVDPYNATNRLVALRRDWEEVEKRNPSGVIVMGSPARLAAGMYAADGHGARCEWTFLHLAGLVTNWFEYTDIDPFDWQSSTTLWMTNGVGDGRFDSINPKRRLWKRPVSAIDFAWPLTNTTVVTAVPATNAFYHAPVWPPTTEDQLFREYMVRNVAERRAPRLPKEVSVHGALWWDAQIASIVPGVPTVRSQAEGMGYTFIRDRNNAVLATAQRTFVYNNVEPFIIQWMGTSPSNLLRTDVLVLYKSYGMTRLHAASVHYYLRRGIGLVAAWGNSRGEWMPYGTTVYDSMLFSMRQTAIGHTHQVYGDFTLRLP